MNKRKLKQAQEYGRKGGLIGGPRRAAKLGSIRCREIAIKAANARWNKPLQDEVIGG